MNPMTELPPPNVTPPAKRKRRVFLWVFLAIQALFLLWLVTAIAGAPEPECEFLTAEECQDATDLGTTLGVALLVFFWVAVDLILGVGYAIYRAAKR